MESFGTTSGHLRSGNFDGFRCKRHQQSNLVFFPTCFASREPATSTNLFCFQENSTGVRPEYHLPLRQGSVRGFRAVRIFVIEGFLLVIRGGQLTFDKQVAHLSGHVERISIGYDKIGDLAGFHGTKL